MKAQKAEKQKPKLFPDIAYGIKAIWNPGEKPIRCEEFEEGPLRVSIENASWLYNFTITMYKRNELLPIAVRLKEEYGYDRDIRILKNDRNKTKWFEYSLKEFLEYKDL